jgi:hypothetical protein
MTSSMKYVASIVSKKNVASSGFSLRESVPWPLKKKFSLVSNLISVKLSYLALNRFLFRYLALPLISLVDGVKSKVK